VSIFVVVQALEVARYTKNKLIRFSTRTSFRERAGRGFGYRNDETREIRRYGNSFVGNVSRVLET